MAENMLSVLVVEDHEALGRLICESMTRWYREAHPDIQIQCHHVTSLAQAVAALQAERMHIVLCDIVLPDRHETALVEQFALAVMDTPIVMISGWPCPEKTGHALIRALFRGESYPFMAKGQDFHSRLHTATAHLLQRMPHPLP